MTNIEINVKNLSEHKTFSFEQIKIRQAGRNVCEVNIDIFIQFCFVKCFQDDFDLTFFFELGQVEPLKMAKNKLVLQEHWPGHGKSTKKSLCHVGLRRSFL